MRAVIQRVKSASVTVSGEKVSEIGRGILALVGVAEGDTEREADQLVNKITSLRLWDESVGSSSPSPALDPAVGKGSPVDGRTQGVRPWRRNVKEIDGQVLCVSQFTLLANVQKGSKPDFHQAAKGEAAKALYDKVLAGVRKALPGVDKVQDGVFGAMMDVALVNDGPVTILLDTADKKGSQSQS
ncbi:unnamed protein product [Tilletia laevis]|uniref:D-aminoacyl-tRNA deacylase n=2 Tax=Tilletia TaxID=13289 RepID=A0A177UQ17_9BASI|nr:hypothetical protein CF336_g2104 [Tilletia laevis]KAE8199820.1 hypothetical protein CF328_g3135 [Tilletia controversa]KAE8261391.1 hypothetical protein A4X03_0g3297 [Tilletia caries]KAE8207258.1 hypothetical protein CF335_g1278 [Tilletia laevis]CAD6883957.1 unnamed protein product [Tilletia caries]